jgi:hypothetical protein
VAAHRLGQVEAYLTVREVLSEASTAADDVLSREPSAFYRCRYATLGLRLSVFFQQWDQLVEVGDVVVCL